MAMPEGGGGGGGGDDGGFLLWANPSSSSLEENNKKEETSHGSNNNKKRGRGGGGGGEGEGDRDGRKLLNEGSDDKKKKKVKEGGIHIWTERERRKKMRNMFANLHALLPQLPPKADKSTIVDEAMSYIKTLQHTLQKLQKQKLERLQGISNFGFDQSAIITQQNKLPADHHQQGSSSNLIGVLHGSDAANKSSKFLSGSPNYPVIFQTWTSSNVVLNICGDEAHISICSSKKPAGMLSTICYVLEKHKIEVLSAQVSADLSRRMYMIQAHVNGASDQFTEALPVEEIYKQAAGELMLWISS